jgi:hypothetical protein
MLADFRGLFNCNVECRRSPLQTVAGSSGNPLAVDPPDARRFLIKADTQKFNFPVDYCRGSWHDFPVCGIPLDGLSG